MARVRSLGWSFLASFLLLTPLLIPARLRADETPRMRDVDRIRIAEAFRLADALQDKIWPGWSKAPFGLVLVTNDYEFLLRHPNPPQDFEPAGEDSLLGGPFRARKRTFSADFLATFPINGVPTIVVGEAENTQAKNSTK